MIYLYVPFFEDLLKKTSREICHFSIRHTNQSCSTLRIQHYRKSLLNFTPRYRPLRSTSSKSNSITLVSTANETFHADSVIVTVPLGCLHRNVIKFTPGLPDRVQKAISNLGFGVFEKLFIRFSEPWWLLPTDDVHSICIECYRFPTLSSIAKHFPGGRLNFISLARTNHPQPVWLAFTTNKVARFLVSKSKSNLKAMLQTNYIPMLPNYDAKNPVCQIIDVDCSLWSQDELSGFGSYTHIPERSDSGNEI